MNITKVISILLFIFIGIGANAVTISYLVGIVSALFVSYLVCKRYMPEIFLKSALSTNVKKSVFSDLFLYSWPLMFFVLIESIFQGTGSFLLGYFNSVRDVGIYDVAIEIAYLLKLTAELFILLFFPLATKEYSKNNIKIVSEMSKQIGKWIFLINFPILILIILFPGAFINILFGSQYLEAETPLRILAAGVVFISLFTISNRLLAMAGKSKEILITMIIAASFNFLLDLLLIPKYGINGAAISAAISFVILSLLLMFRARKYTGIIPLKKEMLRIVIITIVPIILLLLVKNQLGIMNKLNLILLSLFFLLSYIILIFVFKALDKNDLMIIKSIKHKILKINFSFFSRN